MSNFIVLLSLVIGVTAAHHFTQTGHSSSSNKRLLNVTELIASNGYPVQNHVVETKDGYILDLIRIPYGNRETQHSNQHHNFPGSAGYPYETVNNPNNPNKHSSESEASSSSEESGILRPAVLLMHGALASAEDFVIGGPTQGLAYILADNGYDVFLGNTRGSTYGRRHAVLNPERDAAFWRFCFEDMGMKDLPATIDKILDIVEQQQIYYIGHMQGSTAFYIMASEKPEYNEKIHGMVSLGPFAFLGHSTNPMIKLISEKQHSKGWVIKHLGANEFKPSDELITEGGESDCFSKGNNKKICRSAFFLLNGYNSKNLNTTSIMSVINRVHSGVSTKNILHFGQLVKSGRFTKYEQTEEYNLNEVTCPVALMYTPRDALSTLEDVDQLSRKLGNVKQSIRIEELSNNIDLLYGNHVASIVYNKLMKVLDEMSKMSVKNQ